jgi:hypothetical protein
VQFMLKSGLHKVSLGSKMGLINPGMAFASDGAGSMKVMTAAVANIIFATPPWIDPSVRLDLAAFFLLPDLRSSSASEGMGVPCVATCPL